MAFRLLLETHVVVRWLAEPKRLSREQARILNEVIWRRETVAISAITLLEIAMLFSEGRVKMKVGIDELFGELEAKSGFSRSSAHD